MIAPNFDKDQRKAIAQAVAVAALTTLATKLVEWGIERIKHHAAPKPPPEDDT